MCGLVGLVDLRGKRPPDEQLLHAMNESQHHRGPDGGGLHCSPGVGLGHRRLAIIDVASGAQPFYSDDQSIVLVFNGEIYNFQQISAELAQHGHRFRTHSDTEVILHAWQRWGPACVDRFRGMFAFALWDEPQQCLFIARDRLGVKPLYYSLLGDGHIVFGSELKSLLRHPAVRRELDLAAVNDFLTLGYVPEPKSIYQSVRKLPAAHTLLLKRGEAPAAPRRYWDVRFTLDSRMNAVEAGEKLRAMLRESVALRMISEVPLGAFLSGGVDSGAVVATMAAVSSAPPVTCSMAFDNPAFDESGVAAQVAAMHRTSHHCDTVAADDFSLLDRIATLYDEPFADSSALPTYRVCELARRHVTVALSGDGGDETFGGYRRYQTQLSEDRLRRAIPQWLRQGVLAPLSRVWPRLPHGPRVLRARPTLEALARDAVAGYFHEVSMMRPDVLRDVLSDTARRRLDGYTTLDVFRRHAVDADTDDPLAQAQYLDYRTYLVDDINTKVDRASMAHSLEVREPLMDHVMIEWMATLPSALKMHGGIGKRLLKDAVGPMLPPEVISRRKMGFAVPLAHWFRGPLRRHVEQLAATPCLADSGLVDTRGVARLAGEHLAGRRDHSAALWSLSVFAAFLKQAA